MLFPFPLHVLTLLAWHAQMQMLGKACCSDSQDCKSNWLKITNCICCSWEMWFSYSGCCRPNVVCKSKNSILQDEQSGAPLQQIRHVPILEKLQIRKNSSALALNDCRSRIRSLLSKTIEYPRHVISIVVNGKKYNAQHGHFNEGSPAFWIKEPIDNL